MTKQLMSPLDIAWHNEWGLRLGSLIKKHEEAAQYATSHRRKYVVDSVGAAVRLLEPGAFPLAAKVVRFNLDVDDDGNITGGDGAVKEIQEYVWNANSKVSPLADEVRVRAAKRQAAARAVIKVESRDDRHHYENVSEGGITGVIDHGRTDQEARPHGAIQGVRLTSFERGAIYAGGTKAVKEAQRKRAEYDAMPPAQAEKSKADRVAELEQKIRELMGLLKK